MRVLIGKLLGHTDFVTCVVFAPESWKVRSLLALLVQKYLLYWYKSTFVTCVAFAPESWEVLSVLALSGRRVQILTLLRVMKGLGFRPTKPAEI
jgi:hypothetical protein